MTLAKFEQVASTGSYFFFFQLTSRMIVFINLNGRRITKF